jgi:hypothetical protein
LTTVDLSSNRLSGVLVDSFTPPSLSLNLTVNRLSGTPPSTLRESNATVDILSGNLFGCPLLQNDIANSDARSDVSCGSQDLEYPMYAWLVLVILAVVVVVLLIW